ncbi:MAG: glycosyltransferase, partial [archaeon]|nr:glycosyltransferase [archaeon]
MKIAIFQDFIENIGGAEKLVIDTAKKLDATIITTNLNRKAVEDMGGKGIRIIDLGSTPQFFPIKNILIFLKFFFCDFSKEFDFFIFSGNRSIFAAHNHKPNLWYCHSPERSIFDLKEFYKTILPLHEKIIFIFSAELFRFFYFVFGVNKVQKILTNSENTRKRIKKFLKKQAVIVYPPINTANYKNRKPQGYWLSVNRLYPAKRIELQLECFRKLPSEKLFIAGGFVKGDVSEAYAKKISSMLPKNVTLLGNVSDPELIDLYSKCRGFIATALDEDFGMSVAEALASGKAVVCVDEGGFKETVSDGATGFLVKADANALAVAVRKVSENPEKYKNACIKRAELFSSKRFFEKLDLEIKKS